jgi:Protein of unknown function (DUF4232)
VRVGQRCRFSCLVVAVGVFASVGARVGVAAHSVGQARLGPDVCVRSQVRLSITNPESPFTGGTYAVYLNLRNVGKEECSVEGHPIVLVAPHAFPVGIGELANFDRSNPYLGPERALRIHPGRSVRAQIVIGHNCGAGGKSKETHGTVRLFASGRSVSLRVLACQTNGVEIDTGPFLPRR